MDQSYLDFDTGSYNLRPPLSGLWPDILTPGLQYEQEQEALNELAFLSL